MAKTIDVLREKIRVELSKGNVFATAQEHLEGFFMSWYMNAFFKRRCFSLAGRDYPYFYHRRNRTWESERAVEIPVIWDVVQKNQGKRVLEVGNVLPRYFETRHDVVDKYEKKEHVKNIDIVEYRPEVPYDLIVSISTLEHVGFDEQPQEPEKVIGAVKHLQEILAPGGELHITLPVCYNSYLDAMIQDGKLKFSSIYFMKRISPANDWQETGWDKVKDVGYHKGRYWYAQGLIYAVLKK